MTQDRACLARVVVAVVAEVDDSPADLCLQSSRRPDLRHQKSSRKEPARLLAEGDHRLRGSVDVGGARPSPPTPPPPRPPPRPPAPPHPPPPPLPAARPRAEP